MGRFERRFAIEHGEIALLAKFANEARDGYPNVGGPIKASLIYRSQQGELRRIVGCWLETVTEFIEFRVDETHELIIAMSKGGHTQTIEKRRTSTEAIQESISQTAAITVVVRLTNADTGKFLFEQEFQLTLAPLSLK